MDPVRTLDPSYYTDPAIYRRSVENIFLLFHSDLSKQLEFPFTVRVWEGEGKWAEL